MQKYNEKLDKEIEEDLMGHLFKSTAWVAGVVVCFFVIPIVANIASSVSGASDGESTKMAGILGIISCIVWGRSTNYQKEATIENLRGGEI